MIDAVLFDLGDTIIDPPPPHSNVVPEPSTFALLSLGLAGIAIMRKRMRT